MPCAVLQIVPDVLERSLRWTWENYKLPIVIAETGYGDAAGVHDHDRAAYHSVRSPSSGTS